MVFCCVPYADFVLADLAATVPFTFFCLCCLQLSWRLPVARRGAVAQSARRNTSPKPQPDSKQLQARKVAVLASCSNNIKQVRSVSPSATVFAGPGFCNSPAPSALPMPTGALLARACSSSGSVPTPTAAFAASNNLKRLLQVPVAA